MSAVGKVVVSLFRTKAKKLFIYPNQITTFGFGHDRAGMARKKRDFAFPALTERIDRKLKL